jgi:hypothetical protein
VSNNQYIPSEIGGGKWVKNGEKSSQLAKNQILATRIPISSATRFSVVTSKFCRCIFHFMPPHFFTSLSRRSSLMRRRTLHITPIVVVLVLDPAVWRRRPSAVATFGRPGNLRQSRMRESAAVPCRAGAVCLVAPQQSPAKADAKTDAKADRTILSSSFCLLPSYFCTQLTYAPFL